MISAQQLTKRFDGGFTAVDSVSFEVPAGSICAFLGPNGAGKSTTVKMLAGLVEPTSGEARVAGFDVRSGGLELRRAIGVLPEDLGLIDSLTVDEHLQLTGGLYGVTEGETKSRANQLLRALALEEGRSRFIADCSYGMKKKTALAMALLPNPKVLFLDEPFEGIDPVTSAELRGLLENAAKRGITIFLTSHILSIVDRLADHIVMIKAGRIVWDAPVRQLPQEIEAHYFELVESPGSEDLRWLGQG